MPQLNNTTLSLANLLFGPQYPTKEKILGHEIKFKADTINLVKAWKKAQWKTCKNALPYLRFLALKELIIGLAALYDRQTPEVYFEEHGVIGSRYVPLTNTIILDEKTSIITTLHEFAHFLYGASETQACRWSVWLFKKTFPRSYAKLSWDGHLLINKPQTNEGESNLEHSQQTSSAQC